MAKKVCFNINFDSLGSYTNYKNKNLKDPFFFNVADRFFAFAKKFNFKYSIFLIGRDLENPIVAERVKEWVKDGHEIANHTYNHKHNLGKLNYNDAEMEILKSHEIIEKTCGVSPVGFLAPNWSTSSNVIRVLYRNGYLYDTSIFPSYVMFLLLTKLRWNFRNSGIKHCLFQRSDWQANILGPRYPYYSNGGCLTKKEKDGVLVFPLPVTPFFRLPCWHTMSFFTSSSFFNSILRSCLKKSFFYYVMHPADLASPDDLPPDLKGIQSIERLHIPLERKLKIIEKNIQTIVKTSNQFVTLREMANTFKRDKDS